MRKLLKNYGFNSDMQYFEMIVESVINGNKQQAIDQFKAMPKKHRIQFLNSLFTNWISGLNTIQKVNFIQYI